MKKMRRILSLLVAIAMLIGIPAFTMADGAKKTKKTETKSFSAKVSIKVDNEDKLELGDVAILKAKVKGANMAYKVTWQKKVIDENNKEKWEKIGTGDELSVSVTKSAVKNDEYRCVLKGKDGNKIVSSIYRLPKSILQPKDDPAEEEAVKEETTEETASEEEAPEEEADARTYMKKREDESV